MDHYIRIESCGEGTYITRMKAIHIDTLNLVCLKRREKGPKQIPHYLEVTAAREIMNSHPNFVHTLNVLEKYFVQEYIPQDCAEILSKFYYNSKFNEENVKFILKNVLEALKFLHSKKFLHADICRTFFNYKFF
jgi:serine/threonine protein kinase